MSFSNQVHGAKVMTHRTNRTSHVARHAYSVPVVRELPPSPVTGAGSSTW
jgi:hypothetical protein